MRHHVVFAIGAVAVVAFGCSGDAAGTSENSVYTDQTPLPNMQRAVRGGQTPQGNSQQPAGNSQQASSSTAGGGGNAQCRSFCANQSRTCQEYCLAICEVAEELQGQCSAELLAVLQCASVVSVVCQGNGSISLEGCYSEAVALARCFENFGFDVDDTDDDRGDPFDEDDFDEDDF